ncbi:MAG: hypothetical protein OES84_05100, partial [Kiritimatiellaceae bacterium]|nr:hypothetical protein [Kiritimatiellaceae bacterium]
FSVQHVMHSYGKIMSLQRSNSLMITDTEANIKRAREIIEFIDQATAQIEPKIYHIEHADASEIASKLNEIVTAAQGDQKKTAGKTSSSTARTPPGVIRPGSVRGAAAKKAPTKATIDQTEGGTKTIIHGTVKIISDDRTNIIIIFSQEENFAFFEKIIQVLDIIVDPTIKFEVIGLEYADAVELSGTLNDLVGAATGGGSSRSSAGSSRTSSSASNSRTSSSSRTSNKRTSPTGNRSSSNSSQVTPNASPSAVSAIDNLARLSENTKILADERSNSVILMGEKADIAALKIVTKSLDIMLEQVVIEAAIFEIGLDDNLRHGIDWIYGKQGDDRIGSWDGQSILTNSLESVVSGALSYYMNVPGIDSKFLVNVSKTDTNARLVSTPVIMTTDNTEATLSIGEKRPVVTSTSSYANSSGTRSSQYEYKDIGIQLTVTPRINPQRFVVMELSQKADSLGGNVLIDGNEVPVIKNREFDASIAVPDGGTVVLGGLISTETVDSVNKIPILGDIPLIGRYLFSSVSKVDAQRELIVLMTPYVMSDQKEMIEQSERLYEGTSLLQEDWTGSWSESKLRQIPDPPEDLGDEEKKEEK